MPAKKAKTSQNTASITKSVLARTDDGTIQLTITVPFEDVKKVREIAIKHILQDLEIPGFRKGKVPTDIAIKHIDKQKIFEHTLQHLLPTLYTRALQEHSILPVISPRFEIVSVEENKDWTVRAVTCEHPKINLGDYKKLIKNSSAGNIWVPGKDEKKQPAPEEKEQQVIKTLLDTVEVKIPQILVDDEVNHKLSKLLEQVQSLGLTVEQYLSSTGKNLEQVKEEYAKQGSESLKLVLSLNKIAEDEKLEVTDEEIEQIIAASTTSTDSTVTNDEAQAYESPEQRRLVKSILLRRKALDYLTNLL